MCTRPQNERREAAHIYGARLPAISGMAKKISWKE
jgi:hypothetical protein